MAHLNESLMTSAEYRHTVYVVTPPEGTTLDDMLKPEYWAHVAYRLKPDDMIRALPEDRSFYASLVVRTAHRLSARMDVVHYIERGEPEADTVAGDYSVGWGGPAHRYRVIRNSDKEVIQHGFADKGDALKFIDKMSPAKV
jgi:hypothetical protein